MSSLIPDSTDTLADPVYSVSDLNREVRYLLEGNFPSVMVEGEISNIATPASGHWYFTLKDDRAQIRCAMFRNRNIRVRFRPEDGASVLLKAKLSLYEGRGDYQLIVEQMDARGDGALRRAFDELKAKLHQEGLFDEARKRELPEHVRHIGVITSPTGAAIRDILSVLNRRFPAIRVTILPVSVQGQSAARQMISAIELANQRKGCLQDLDVLLIGRGGGSLEDLWSFNDEALARAIVASDLPVVSAVGHEVDFSIADFVADLRAATPTAAAELLSPDQAEYAELFSSYEQRLASLALNNIRALQQKLLWLRKQMRHPGRRLQDQAQALDALEARLQRAVNNDIYRARTRLRQVQNSLRLNSPLQLLEQHRRETRGLGQRLRKAMSHLLKDNRQKLARYSHSLNAVSPLATLSRGYAIAFDGAGHIIRSCEQVEEGMAMKTRLHTGTIHSVVSAVEKTEATPTAKPKTRS